MTVIEQIRSRKPTSSKTRLPIYCALQPWIFPDQRKMNPPKENASESLHAISRNAHCSIKHFSRLTEVESSSSVLRKFSPLSLPSTMRPELETAAFLTTSSSDMHKRIIGDYKPFSLIMKKPEFRTKSFLSKYWS